MDRRVTQRLVGGRPVQNRATIAEREDISRSIQGYLDVDQQRRRLQNIFPADELAKAYEQFEKEKQK